MYRGYVGVDTQRLGIRYGSLHAGPAKGCCLRLNLGGGSCSKDPVPSLRSYTVQLISLLVILSFAVERASSGLPTVHSDILEACFGIFSVDATNRSYTTVGILSYFISDWTPVFGPLERLTVRSAPIFSTARLERVLVRNRRCRYQFGVSQTHTLLGKPFAPPLPEGSQYALVGLRLALTLGLAAPQ